MFRSKGERDEKDEGLQHDDAAAGGAVQEVAGIRADDAAQRPGDGGDGQHPPEAIRQQVGRGPGGDEHGDDEDAAHALGGHADVLQVVSGLRNITRLQRRLRLRQLRACARKKGLL